MNGYAAELLDSSICLGDYGLENPLVTAAYNDFTSYSMLYAAGCLTSSVSGAYCFVEATSNSSLTQDSYLYYLPLDVTLPSGVASNGTCTQCASDVMAIFYNSGAGNTSLALSRTYLSAAKALDAACGDEFADTNVVFVESTTTAEASASATTTGAAATATSRTVLSAIVIAMLLVWNA